MKPLDPFSPEADPYPPGPELPRVTRRELLVLAPATALAASGCATPRLACAPRPDDAGSCHHRFCRHYRARAPG